MEHTHIAKDGTVYTHTHEEVHEHGHSHSHPHHHENTKAVLNRMNRAIGHMEAVKTMIEDGRDCSEVLIQIAAVRSAINNIGKIILEDHINHCLVDAIETGDEQVLKELGYAFVSDPSYSQGYFIEPLDQTERSYQYYLENDIRYSYSYADFKDGDKVTAIGIQDGQTLKKAPGMTEYLMKGDMDMETAIKEDRKSVV